MEGTRSRSGEEVPRSVGPPRSHTDRRTSSWRCAPRSRKASSSGDPRRGSRGRWSRVLGDPHARTGVPPLGCRSIGRRRLHVDRGASDRRRWIDMQTQLERPSIRMEGTNLTSRSDARYVFAGLTIACIWLATAAASIWSPVMITGIGQERLAIAAVIDWFPAAIASGLVLMAFSRRTRGASRSLWLGFLIAIGSIWAAVAAVSIFSPAARDRLGSHHGPDRGVRRADRWRDRDGVRERVRRGDTGIERGGVHRRVVTCRSNEPAGPGQTCVHGMRGWPGGHPARRIKERRNGVGRRRPARERATRPRRCSGAGR